MIIADINVRFSTIDVILRDKLPCGAAGLKVRFRFMDPAWNGLSKIAVFRNRSQTLNVAIVEDCAAIPHELLTKVLDVIDVGVYGTDGDKMLGIPTLWGSLGTVASAADPSGDSSMDPTLPYWAQIKEQVDMLENTILGNEDPESIRVSALRTSGGKMSGSIDMCGNMVTGLGSPAGNTDAVNLEYANGHFRSNTWLPTVAEIGAAPAGYGLGESAGKYVTDCHAINKAGFYQADANTAHRPPYFDHCVIYANIVNGYIYLTATYAEMTAKCYYSVYTGTWQPWEYVNPPMIPGEEYRTTERWNGKAVYVKLVDCGNLPNASEKWVRTGIPKDGTTFVGMTYHQHMTEIGGIFSYHPNVLCYTTKADPQYTDYELYFRTSSNESGSTLQVVLKYVKN